MKCNNEIIALFYTGYDKYYVFYGNDIDNIYDGDTYNEYTKGEILSYNFNAKIPNYKVFDDLVLENMEPICQISFSLFGNNSYTDAILYIETKKYLVVIRMDYSIPQLLVKNNDNLIYKKDYTNDNLKFIEKNMKKYRYYKL